MQSAKPHRHRYSFLLTVLWEDCDPAQLRGRWRFVATGHEQSFNSLAELEHGVRAEIQAQLAELNCKPSSSTQEPL